MDTSHDLSPPTNETDIRRMLEESRQDIAEGRTRPMGPVLERMRAAAEAIRQGRDGGRGDYAAEWERR